MPAAVDPYALDASAVREPPKTLRESWQYLGPGFILSASIVGSGELIATTTVGAKAGFVLMWFIIFSCLIKVAVQLEFGKHAICSGESTMASLNTLPGPRVGKANWSIWTWLLLMVAKMMQVGGIVGGVVLAIEQFAPTPTIYDLTALDRDTALVLQVGETGPAMTLPAPWTPKQAAAQLEQQQGKWKFDGREISCVDPSIPPLWFRQSDAESQELATRLPPLRILLSFAVAASVSVLVYRGYYLLVEKASLIMIGAFTCFTLISLLALQTTDLAITAPELLSGLIPNLPSDSAIIMVAIGAFGITGVGGDEIMAYNYWLIEKGYAAYTGPRDDSPEWRRRANGWIRIMHLDALLSMLAYTAMTVMFYLLGAAVLHRQGLVPEGEDLIGTLGAMYTQSLGPWARFLFVIGAIVVLYSTLFAALAAWTRMFADAFGRLGLYRFEDSRSRHRAIGVLAWIIPALWATLFLYMGKPALMVILGGTATVVILLIVVFAAMWFRYRRLDHQLLPTKWYDLCLWTSAIAITVVAMLSAKSVYKELWSLIN